MRILVVEDEALIAMALTITLTDPGHEVVGVASTAAGAIERAGEGGADLALIDLHLAPSTWPKAAAVWRRRAKFGSGTLSTLPTRR